jgi:non-specific serine/threonine protein kinase
LIASLVDKSLLRQEDGPGDEPRYAMLDTVREYGLEQLAASGEEAKVRRAHAHWCVALAERADPAIFGGADHVLWLDRLEADFANLRAALGWLEETGDGAAFLRLAAALGGLWRYRSHRIEGRDWLTRALAQDPGTVPAARAMALAKLGVLEREMGGAKAAELIAESVAVRRALGNVQASAHSLIALGIALRVQGDFDGAARVLEEAAALLEPLGDIGGFANTRLQLGITALDQGAPDRAREFLMTALDLYRREGFVYGVARTLLALGRVDVAQGATLAAAVRYTESLRLWEEIKSQEGLVDTLAETSGLALAAGQPDSATRFLRAADAHGDLLGYIWPPTERARYERVATAARAALGDEAFATAWSDGRALTTEAATSEASAVLAELAVPTKASNGEAPLSPAGLTPREREVLALVAGGLSDREVAAALFVGPGTIRSHLTSIFGKLEVGSRTAAIAAARRRGIL